MNTVICCSSHGTDHLSICYQLPEEKADLKLMLVEIETMGAFVSVIGQLICSLQIKDQYVVSSSDHLHCSPFTRIGATNTIFVKTVLMI